MTLSTRAPSLTVAMVLISLLFAPRAVAQNNPTPEQLIDQLVRIDCNGPGLYEDFPYADFWAVVPDLDYKEHLEGKDCVPEAMRMLVRLGAKALPALVRHIDDKRPTGLKIGVKEDPRNFQPGGQAFAEEYESRAHVYRAFAWPSSFLDECGEDSCFTGRGFAEPYTIRVGDVCFTLIGQIVNRYMVAARYQPTWFVIVNSPMEAPSLAKRVRTDWTSVGADDLKKSLLTDLHMSLSKPPSGYKKVFDKVFAKDPLSYEERQALSLRTLYAGALRRLRFYYPETYAALTGDDLAKKQAFEKNETEVRAGYEKAERETRKK